MSHIPPRIRRKKRSGREGLWYYFVRWGSPPRDFYLAADSAAARRLFLDPAGHHPGSLAAWRAWRDSLPDDSPVSRAALPHPSQRTFRFVRDDLAERYRRLGREQARSWIVDTTTRFTRDNGGVPIGELAASRTHAGLLTSPAALLLADMIESMLAEGLSNKTIVNAVKGVKRVFAEASRLGLAPRADFSRVEVPRARRGRPEVLTPAHLAAALQRCRAAEPALWTAPLVAYLCAARSSEAVRLCRFFAGCQPGAGRTADIADRAGVVAGGLFALEEHKGAHRGGEPRMVVITPAAASALALVKPGPEWGLAPHRIGVRLARALAPVSMRSMRDTAASACLAGGMDLAMVRILLGHVPSGEWRSYGLIPWRRIREEASVHLTPPVTP